MQFFLSFFLQINKQLEHFDSSNRIGFVSTRFFTLLGFFDDSPPGPFDFYKGKIDSNYRQNKLTFGPTGGLFEKEFKRLFVGEALPEVTSFDDARFQTIYKIKRLYSRFISFFEIVRKCDRISVSMEQFFCSIQIE